MVAPLEQPSSWEGDPIHGEQSGGAPRPPVEIGWVLVGGFDPAERRAISEAEEAAEAYLSGHFASYDFRLSIVERRRETNGRVEQPVDLIDIGASERHAARWDFALVLTPSELCAREKPFMLGAPASALNVAVLSTARLVAPSGARGERPPEGLLVQRIVALFFHLFGHLNHLAHDDDEQSFMFPIDNASSLDRMTRFSEEDLGLLDAELAEEADTRLEESRTIPSAFRFYLAVAFSNRRDILGAIVKIRPWFLPARLSKLMTTAASALLVLIITAEAWDLGMTQSPATVVAASIAALFGTSYYVLRRQRLVERFRSVRLTEQRAVGNISVSVSVVLAMATTYAVLFAITLGGAYLFFDERLVQAWAASLAGRPTVGQYLSMAGFVATLGVCLGALGASFEEEHHFRHVAMLDEET